MHELMSWPILHHTLNMSLWTTDCFGTLERPTPRHPRHHKVLNCVLYEMNDGVDFGHSLAASDLLIEVEAGGHTV